MLYAYSVYKLYPCRPSKNRLASFNFISVIEGVIIPFSLKPIDENENNKSIFKGN